MLKLQRHHKLLLVLIAVFVIAWGVWTLFLLPRSETPNLPVPTQTMPNAEPGK